MSSIRDHVGQSYEVDSYDCGVHTIAVTEKDGEYVLHLVSCSTLPREDHAFSNGYTVTAEQWDGEPGYVRWLPA